MKVMLMRLISYNYLVLLENAEFQQILPLYEQYDLESSYEYNPSPEWTDKLKETLKSNEIDYDEYVVNIWPSEIPEFDIPDYVFILRYSYDIDSKIDKFASNQLLFEEFIKKSDWEEYYKDNKIEEKTRVIVLCSDVKNLILHNTY